jgi:hypothetical protein
MIGRARRKNEKRSTIAKTKTRCRVALKPRVNLEEDEIFGFMAGKMKIVGDVESPLPDWKYWNPAKNLEK